MAWTALSGVTPLSRDAPSPMLRLSLPLRIARIRTARSPRFRLPRSFGLAALLALVAFAPTQEAKAQWAVIDPAHIAKSIYNGRQILQQLRAQRDQLVAFRENVRKLRSYNVRDVGGLIDQFDRTIVSGGQLAYTSADLAREFDETYRSFDVNDPAGEARRVYQPDSARVREAVGIVRPLAEAGIPTVAVLGDHDFSLVKESREPVTVYADSLRERLEALGSRVIEDDAVPVVAGGDPLWVVGVGSVGTAITPRGVAGRTTGSPWG